MFEKAFQSLVRNADEKGAEVASKLAKEAAPKAINVADSLVLEHAVEERAWLRTVEQNAEGIGSHETTLAELAEGEAHNTENTLPQGIVNKPAAPYDGHSVYDTGTQSGIVNHPRGTFSQGYWR
jgi:hypothetical protein